MSDKVTDLRPKFFRIENAVIDDYGLDPYSGWLYVVIAKHADNQTGEAFPGIARLCNLANMSRSQVMRSIKVLEDKNLIRVDRDTIPGTGEKRQRGVNHYYLLSASKRGEVVSTRDYPSASEKLGVVSDVNCNYTHTELDSENKDIPPKGANDNAPKKAKKQREPDAYDQAITKVWDNAASGFITQVKGMMFGCGKKHTTWEDCNFNPPVTDPAEILGFGEYMVRRMALQNNSIKPTAAVTIQRWFYDFRAEQKRKAAQPAQKTDKSELYSTLMLGGVTSW